MSEQNTLATMTDDQRALYEMMSDISEDGWCAGWLHDNEFNIWAALTTGYFGSSLYGIDPESLARVKELSDKTGGWIEWRGSEHGLPLDQWGPYFVPMAEWLQIVSKNKEARLQSGDRG